MELKIDLARVTRPTLLSNLSFQSEIHPLTRSMRKEKLELLTLPASNGKLINVTPVYILEAIHLDF